jgi:hypothetical protein
MSDEFDKRRGPDDDDDESFDWLSDDSDQPESGKPSGDKLGFTGDLSWRQDVEDAFNRQLDQSNEDATFDWQKSQPGKSGPADSSGLGFTGQLDWKKVQPEDDLEETRDEPLDWGSLTGDEEQPPDEPAAALPDEEPSSAYSSPFDEEPLSSYSSGFDEEPEEEEEDGPVDLSMWFGGGASQTPDEEPEDDDWMPELGADEEASAAPEDAGIPDWLRGSEPAALSEEQPAQADVPDWLQAADDAAPEEESPVEDDVPDWMQDMGIAEDELAAPVVQMDVPDWLQAADEATPEEESPVEDDVPDWMRDMGVGEEAPAAPVSQSDVPDWLQAADEATPEEATPAEDDVPDWMREMGVADEPDEQPAPDWMQSLNQPTDTPQADEEPDLFSGLDEAFASMPGVEEESTPDLLEDAAQPAAESDIFAELGLSSVQTGYDFLDNPEPAAEDDLLSGLDLQPSSSDDWLEAFNEPAPASTEGDLNWLDALGDAGQDAAPASADEPAAVPADEDFLADLDFLDEPPEEPALPDFSKPALQDIDSLLASYDTALPELNAPLNEADVDRLFSDAEKDRVSAKRSEIELSPDVPDWIRENISVDEISAAAIVRQQKDRPLEELPDRLQALHERSLELPTPADEPAPSTIQSLLPGVNEVITAAPIHADQSALSSSVALTKQQRSKLDLLKTLVASDETAPRPAAPSAIDLTLDAPAMADLLGEDETPAPAAEITAAEEAAPARTRRRSRYKFDRLLIAVLVLAAVLLPFFVSSTRLGSLPPPAFAAGSRQSAVFDAVNQLSAGQLVLVAVEYGPTGAAELDGMADDLLRHIVMRGARPVLLGGNAVGLLHAREVLERINTDSSFLAKINRAGRPLAANADYYVLRYLPADAVGLRSFSGDVASLVSTDVNGAPTNLKAKGLADFARIIVISERPEELRGWAEQVAPLMSGRPLLAAVSAAAGPLAEPYMMPSSPVGLSGLGGMLVGYRDAYTYRSMLDAILYPERVTPTVLPPTSTPVTPTSTPLPTETPVETAQAVPPVAATGEATGTGAATEAVQPSATVSEPSATPLPTDTQLPTDTLAPSDTPAGAATAQPTDTPAGTEPPTPTVENVGPTATFPVITAVVNANQAINVRQGPATTFPPLATLQPNQEVQVTGRSGDGKWLKVKLADGREGWVSASLLTVQEPGATATQISMVDPNAVVSLMSDMSFYSVGARRALPLQQAESTSEATSEATAATAPVRPTPPVTPAGVAAVDSMPYREERWYSMTLGLVAIIAVIAIGAVLNILRAIFRRERR